MNIKVHYHKNNTNYLNMYKKIYQIFNRWLPVLAASLFFFYWFVQLSLNNTLIEFYIIKYQIYSYGTFTSLYLIGNVIMFIPAGIILDRFKTKNVICICIIMMILAITWLTLFNNKLLAYTCMLIIGFSGAFSLLSCIRIATNSFGVDKVGFPVSITITIGFLGGYVGNTYGHKILEYYKTGTAVQIANIILGLVVLTIVMIFVKNYNKKVIKKSVKIFNIIENLYLVIKRKQNWLVGLYISFMNFPIMILEFSFGQAYLNKSFLVTANDAAVIAGTISLGYMIGGPIWNKLSDGILDKKKLMFAGSFVTLIITLLLMKNSLTYYNLFFLFFFLGISTASQNIGYPVIAQSNELNNTASATSLASIIIMGGGALIQILFGFLNKTISINFAYITVPIFVLISFIIVFFIKDTKMVSKSF